MKLKTSSSNCSFDVIVSLFERFNSIITREVKWSCCAVYIFRQLQNFLSYSYFLRISQAYIACIFVVIESGFYARGCSVSQITDVVELLYSCRVCIQLIFQCTSTGAIQDGIKICISTSWAIINYQLRNFKLNLARCINVIVKFFGKSDFQQSCFYISSGRSFAVDGFKRTFNIAICIYFCNKFFERRQVKIFTFNFFCVLDKQSIFHNAHIEFVSVISFMACYIRKSLERCFDVCSCTVFSQIINFIQRCGKCLSCCLIYNVGCNVSYSWSSSNSILVSLLCFQILCFQVNVQRRSRQIVRIKCSQSSQCTVNRRLSRCFYHFKYSCFNLRVFNFICFICSSAFIIFHVFGK
ncbi:hypothetical protein BSPP4475_01875 [Brevibacillus aydinogluensis]|uniref:Transmembrane protein n=1 Tax=Brevibacillus aydinogluensis TaxID=927786 RepID=A0AA48M6Y6_9BACL|nr:hypothetical protein BSPP4475_01875 [Brevibacillus aydinogluensis]